MQHGWRVFTYMSSCWNNPPDLWSHPPTELVHNPALTFFVFSQDPARATHDIIARTIKLQACVNDKQQSLTENWQVGGDYNGLIVEDMKTNRRKTRQHRDRRMRRAAFQANETVSILQRTLFILTRIKIDQEHRGFQIRVFLEAGGTGGAWNDIFKMQMTFEVFHLGFSTYRGCQRSRYLI